MNKVGDDIIQGLQEALAYTRGEDVPGIRVHHIEDSNIDLKAIRNSLRLTQEQMAQLFGTSVSGYRKWEQKTRRPSGAARTLMLVMEKEPEAALRALTDWREYKNRKDEAPEAPHRNNDVRTFHPRQLPSRHMAVRAAR